MLDYIINQTDSYIMAMSKDVRKSLGQFFTSKSTARFMAELFDVPRKDVIKVLDPGAGSGILSAAVVDMLNESYPHIKQIELTCYETDKDILPLLSDSLEYLKQKSKIKISTRLITDNYLLSQADDFTGTISAARIQSKYDLVIGNPPYFKLTKDAPEAVSMPDVCHGAPNIYFLFAAMSLFNLTNNGELVYIVPRSWTSGSYFSRFRDYLLHHGKLTDIHIFTSRNKVFDKEKVLQETMIMKVKKTQTVPESVQITSSIDSSSFDMATKLNVPYDCVVSGKEKYVYLVTSQEEAEILNRVNAFSQRLPSIGLKMKTGLTVDFRNRELLRNNIGEHIVPLFYSQHIKNGRVVFPIGKENEYMTDELPGIIQRNRNYLFVKRFTAKEERRRLQCAVYLASHYPEYQEISTQNKINFIDTIDNSEMSKELVYGLYIVLNSTLYDKYYRILNGSTQVNATEINAMPIPSRHHLEDLGRRVMNTGNYSTEYCDRVLEEVVNA
jgi:adenine-specific DNA-methyltransferase